MGNVGPPKLSDCAQAASDGESEIEESGPRGTPDTELPGTKGLAQDLEESSWTRAMGGDTGCAPGLEIFVLVGTSPTSFEAVTDRIDPGCLGLVSTDFPAVCDPEHECSGLAGRICGHCMRNKKECWR